MAKRRASTSFIARRYARALFMLAEEAGKLDILEQQLQSLKAAVTSSDLLKNLLENPVLSRGQIAQAIDQVLGDAKLDALTKKFIGTLGANRRLSLLPEIADAFAAMQQTKRGEEVAVVTSAAPLSKEQLAAVVADLQKATGKKILLKTEVNPEILGGVKVRIGSRELDNSLQGRLNRMKQHLTKSIYQTV